MEFLRALKQKNQSVKECLAQAEMHFPKNYLFPIFTFVIYL